MTVMTEQANRAGRVSEWIVVGAFSCLLVVLLVQLLSWFVFEGALTVSVAFLTSPLIAAFAVITWVVLFIIKRRS